MSRIPVKDVTPEVEIVSLYAEREHIYVKFYRGLYKNLRIISSAAMLIAFYGASWIQYDGRQAIHFDLPGRQFHIFSQTFWPQDFMLLSWLLIILAFTLFFVTVFAGRLWCGYACPQFVWTWFFIWAERITEGDRNARMKRDEQPMSAEKFLRKTAKHGIWVIIAVATSVAFMGYFTPIRELIPNVLVLDIGPWETWWLAFFAVATYGNAGWLREQVCIYMCPYARFQSVMFDQDTLVISYDEKRGETRGSRKRDADYKAEGLGDCIDCGHCVHVCPVGIDIRDGLQYECVACGACVDACDDIMERMGYEKGLVRYTTEHELEGKKTRLLRPRLIGYLIALLAMVTAFSYVLITRTPLEVDTIRGRGELYTTASNGDIRNSYSVKIANKSQQDMNFRITLEGLEFAELVGATEVRVEAGELLDHTLFIEVDPRALERPNYKIEFEVTSIDDDSISATSESRFIGPTL
ncbi:MAG TPA: cytochrome c oxidase accessory protein CcoG [Marinobacterium sp.]|nr:cytochrome c oxidase accessory protein CcoG [Marinobacterium sp.]